MKNVRKPGKSWKRMNSSHFWQVTIDKESLYNKRKVACKLIYFGFRTSNYFFICSKYDGKNIFEKNLLASNDVNSLSVELSSLYSLRSLMNDDPISIKVSSSWICLLFGRHRDRWALATLSWRDQSQIHEFCKDVDDGFVLARIWTTTVWTDDCRELALAIANRQ